jgi:phage terminase large subunit
VSSEFVFDWKNPDYVSVYIQRMNRLKWVRERPEERVPALMAYYRTSPADMINDWGETYDPRNADVDLPTFIPFLLMPRQRELIEYTMRKWKERKPGLVEKARDCGASWVSVSLGCCLCLTHTGLSIGYGSRKEEYVDKLDGPKSLFYKGRKFMERLPAEFTNGWNPKKDAPHMRMLFRATESTMNGEAGDGIGRGDRQAIYFVDEAAHLERPQLVEASLGSTTNCRIDMSSVNGSANPFAEKAREGKIEKFIFDWRDDLRKDDAWYAKYVDEHDPVTVAQEVDRDYNASVEGVLIPSKFVQAAIDAHLKLGLSVSGARFGALDIADEGKDNNAFIGGQGFLLDVAEEWSGKGGDIFQSVERAFLLCDEHDYDGFLYDADGLGAGVRGDSRVINDRRPKETRLFVDPFQGSGAVDRPEHKEYYGRANKDFFQNKKAQYWWGLRKLFQNTYRWVMEGQACDPDEIISLSGKLACLSRLTSELSQPTYSINTAGKIVIDKAPEGSKSPNLGDGAMMRMSRTRRGRMAISSAAIQRARARA